MNLLFNFLLIALSTTAFAHAASTGPVKVQGRQLMVDFDKDGKYEPFLIKSVGYSPTPIGRHPSDWGWPGNDPRPNNMFDDPAILERDFILLENMHTNAIRIWKGNNTTLPNGRFPNKLTKRTLDMAHAHHLKIIAGFWVEDVDFTIKANQDDLIQRFANYVSAFKDHPAILFWAIGNENNYRFNPNTSSNIRAFYSLVNAMAQKAHVIEGSNYHPVAIVNGELNNIGNATFNATDAQMPALDIWGTNVYRGSSFGTLFRDYALKSQKPLWIAEFGVDAWFSKVTANPSNGYEDQLTQSQWLTKLWGEIETNKATAIGGSVMEYSDEWWKPYEFRCGNNSDACNRTHDYTGNPLASCPDKFSNEEWFGLMAIAPSPNKAPDQMIARLGYSALKEQWAPHDAPVITPIANQNFKSGQRNTLAIKFNDPQGQLKSIDLRLANGDPLISVGTTVSNDLVKGTSVLTWNPKAYQRGTYLIIVTAENKFSLKSTTTFTINVTVPIPAKNKNNSTLKPGPRPNNKKPV